MHRHVYYNKLKQEPITLQNVTVEIQQQELSLPT